MPFLKAADSVVLCTVTETKNTDTQYTGANEMVIHLKRQGIKAEAQHISSGNMSVSTRLLKHITDSGADMLVSGAYSHNSVKEAILGGVTRDLLAHCNVPFLMSK